MRLYYFNPDKAIAYTAAQDKGNYTITYDAGSNPRTWTVVYSPAYYPLTAESVYLPLPESELIAAPSLAAQPVPFDFSKLPK
jgi:hypothetical protein